MTLKTCERWLELDVRGCRHAVLVRGREDAPVLLVVQQGPGFPLICEAEVLERQLQLEGRFRVAWWDQRGTGRSVDSSDAPLTLEDLTADVKAIAEQLCAALNTTSVSALGFSLGGTLALLAAEAGAPIDRLVLVGPDVDFSASEDFAWRFARAEALRRGAKRALRALDTMGPPPHVTPDQFMTRVRFVADFGGVQLGASFLQIFLGLLWRLLRSRWYSLPQVFRALRSMATTQARTLPALRALNLLSRPIRVPGRVTVLQGRLDAAAPPALAEALISRLDAAGGKELVWLDECAHNPHFEAADRVRPLVSAAL
ncbi:MAG: alpha/beta hydrolase [Myxococcaceae bacterium]